MVERRLNLGTSASDARYAIEDSGDSTGGGDLRLLDVSGATPVEIGTYSYDTEEWTFGDTNHSAVSTDEAHIGSSAYTGPDSRPLVSNANQNPIVAADGTGDYTTIQEAVDNIPFYLRHKYVIGIQDGDYSTEDVVIPQTVTGTAVPGSDTSGDEFGQIALNGNGTMPGNVLVNSIAAAGVVGHNSPYITGMEIQGVVPWDNEVSGIVGYASGLDVGTVNFADSGVANDRAITFYASNGAKVSGDIGLGASTRTTGIVVKRSGSVNATGATITGSVSGDLISVLNGYLAYDSSAVPSGHTINHGKGLILDVARNMLMPVFGYTKGDVIPVLWLSSYQLSDDGWTNTTYDGLASFYQYNLRLDRFLPTDVQVKALMSFQAAPGTDETIDVRWQQTTNGETAAEITGIASNGFYDTGWVDYNPGFANGQRRYKVERRTDTGTNTNIIRNVVTQLGIEI